MKKIGFIDFFLDEWHANNYPTWIRENAAAVGRDMDVVYAWGKIAAPGGLDTDAWCRQYKVQALASLEEVVEKSDYLIVLSPDHPEQHEELTRVPLMSGKPTFVDKTFSPDLASGVRMFDLAEKCNTPMFSSSALRHIKEFETYPDQKVNPGTLEYVATLGPGKFANYAVHQLEMIVTLLGPGATRLKSHSSNHGTFLTIEYGDGRRASMLQIAGSPFQASLQLKDGDGVAITQATDMFPRATHAMLDFFETGKPPVSRTETLAIMALIDAGCKALAQNDTWVNVDQA